MAVDQLDVIDFVSHAQDGSCVLTISDHLNWDGGESHPLILQEKFNRYLAFIESGELVEKFREFEGVPVLIKVYFMHEPDSQGTKFLSLAKGVIENAGFRFEYKVGLD